MSLAPLTSMVPKISAKVKWSGRECIAANSRPPLLFERYSPSTDGTVRAIL